MSLIHELMSLEEEADILVRAATKKLGLKVACRPGCPNNSCCELLATCTPFEGYRIAKWVLSHGNMKNFFEQNEEMILERARLATSDGMDLLKWANLKLPCVFSKEKKCVIYPARPNACRLYQSHGVETCGLEIGSSFTIRNLDRYFLVRLADLHMKRGCAPLEFPLPLAALIGYKLALGVPVVPWFEERLGSVKSYFMKAAETELASCPELSGAKDLMIAELMSEGVAITLGGGMANEAECSQHPG